MALVDRAAEDVGIIEGEQTKDNWRLCNGYSYQDGAATEEGPSWKSAQFGQPISWIKGRNEEGRDRRHQKWVNLSPFEG